MLTVAMLVYAVTQEIVEMTERNLGALLRNTTGDFEVRLLINGGPVVSLPPHPNLVPIYMAERSSIAHAYNLAFSGSHGDTLACVHNDVEVPPARRWRRSYRRARASRSRRPSKTNRNASCAA
jgi:alkanesulfonate monooxygenase SsuD/methylene tetrahydromethanopterin reductase-like flavin-dependent oxidoreductase (luciferase family)